jgi:class 3 adenylate cyclase
VPANPDLPVHTAWGIGVEGMRKADCRSHERDPQLAAILVSDIVGYSRLAGISCSS